MLRARVNMLEKQVKVHTKQQSRRIQIMKQEQEGLEVLEVRTIIIMYAAFVRYFWLIIMYTCTIHSHGIIFHKGDLESLKVTCEDLEVNNYVLWSSSTRHCWHPVETQKNPGWSIEEAKGREPATEISSWSWASTGALLLTLQSVDVSVCGSRSFLLLYT